MVWLPVVPDDGARLTGFGYVTGDPDTACTPMVCQPELPCDMSRAAAYTTLLPPNVGAKDTLSTSVSVLPLPVADDPARLTEH